MARRPLEREPICLDGGRRTPQLMRDSLGRKPTMDSTPISKTTRLGVGTRLPIAIAAYLARVLAFGWTPDNPPLALLIDIGVSALCIWAVAPGRQQFGPNFGRRTHWTGIFAIPILAAIALGIHDLALLAQMLGI